MSTETETPAPAPPQPDDDDEGGEPAFEGTISAAEPVVAPDGHVNLSAEDIEARDAEA